MRLHAFCLGLLLVAAGALSLLTAAQGDKQPVKKAPPEIAWKKTVLDTKFLSEGVAVADVNKDGKMDILNGEAWYEAPNWKRHEIQKLGDHKNGLGNYSRSFCCWAEDLNGDGYP